MSTTNTIKYLGVTATRSGLTEAQKTAFEVWLESKQVECGCHGDCKGGDEDIHNIMMEKNIKIHVHPPIKSIHRAFVKGYHKRFKPKEYLVRNKDIVDKSDVMCGFPFKNQKNGGTITTMRMAKKMKKTLYVFYHDGSYCKNPKRIK